MMMKRIIYLGDIHGNFPVINRHIKNFDIKDCVIIQVGDFGVGFSSLEKERRSLEMTNSQLEKRNIILYAIRGNHDYKPYFDNDPFGFSNIKLIPDYTVLNINDKNILCVGGAVSVDRTWRYNFHQRNGIFDREDEGQTWWPDEVFTLDIDKLSNLKDIDIVVTHTSPSYCPIDNTYGFGPFVNDIIKNSGDTELPGDLMFERMEMNNLFLILKENGNEVKNHYYGHFHRSDDITMNGTKHRLLNIDEFYEEREDK